MNLAVDFSPRKIRSSGISSRSDDWNRIFILYMTVENMPGHNHDLGMANTFASLHYHIVFSTKNREPWIGAEIETRIWEYLGGIARENGMTPIQIGGRPDHIHILLTISPTVSVSSVVQLLKGGSSKWIKTSLAGKSGFAWQDGYGAFTVSKSSVAEVVAYIQNQAERHRTTTFQEEYLAFLDRHGIEFDKRYVLG